MVQLLLNHGQFTMDDDICNFKFKMIFTTFLSLKLKFLFSFFTTVLPVNKTATPATLKYCLLYGQFHCVAKTCVELPADAVEAKARLFEKYSNPLRIA